MKKVILKMKWVCWVLLVFVTMSASAAGKLYAIIAADTTDPSIGDSTRVDVQTMSNQLNQISQATGLPSTVILVQGKNNLAKNLWQKISSLDVDADDVVLFYYSGHGFRDKAKDPSPWPYLYFNIDDSFLDYERVIAELKSKDPRFLVTIVDVCNSYIDAEPRMIARSVELTTKEMQEKINKNYAHLFLDFSGSVSVTSSSTGEYSWGGDAGGLFTTSFATAIKKAVRYSDNLEWEDILHRTEKVIGEDEHPYFETDLTAD